MSQQTIQEPSGSLGSVLAVIVVSLAIAGYFIGLQAPMADHRSQAGSNFANLTQSAPGSLAVEPSSLSAKPEVLPATHYSELAQVIRAREAHHRSQSKWAEKFGNQVQTSQMTKSNSPLSNSKIDFFSDSESLSNSVSQPSLLDSVKTANLRPDVKSRIRPVQEEQIVITQADKDLALELRSSNRAFNGAPPTVPHAIDQMSSESCMLCHEHGFSMATLRASKMSHQFLSECTQCHVENSPAQRPPSLLSETTFVGLPAPKEGPRAFVGAPPQIPHTTWMRVDCLSCHGPNGALGIRTTHPWRQDCQQCHAVASGLEQSQPGLIPAFLPPIKVTP